MNKYSELRAIDVSAHIEKKSNLSYLSWVWAVDQLLQLDPAATWEYREPVRFGNDSIMVFCTVHAFGKAMTAQLPVMDHRNKAIANPDAFDVNKAMQRCLAKAIALHGIGLYIYAGEDLPEAPAAPVQPVAKPKALTDDELEDACIAIGECDDMESLKGIFTGAFKRANADQQAVLTSAKDARKLQLESQPKKAA